MRLDPIKNLIFLCNFNLGSYFKSKADSKGEIRIIGFYNNKQKTNNQPNHFSIYSFVTDTSITCDLFPLFMDVVSQDHHVSQSLFSVSQWLVLLNCWDYLVCIWCLLGQFFSRRDNSSHALIGRHVYPIFFQINLYSIYNINLTDSLLTIVVMTVDCGMIHPFQSLQLLYKHLFRINKFS